MDLVRLTDWQPRLIEHVNSWRNTEYAYGRTDCTRFAHGAVIAVTGIDILPGFTWPSGWLGAAKLMIAKGWESVEDPVRDLLPEMAVADCRSGDLISYRAGDELHLGVRVGDSAVAPATKGLGVVERSLWARAWRVG